MDQSRDADERGLHGRCLCGAVTFDCTGPANWCGHCHCESCRRNTASGFTTFFGMPRAAVRWTGAAPARYESSPGVRRLFCARCGTPMAYDADRYPHEIHLYLASLEDASALRPSFHVHCAERVDWIELADALPRYPHGGS